MINIAVKPIATPNAYFGYKYKVRDGLKRDKNLKIGE